MHPPTPGQTQLLCSTPSPTTPLPCPPPHSQAERRLVGVLHARPHAQREHRDSGDRGRPAALHHQRGAGEDIRSAAPGAGPSAGAQGLHGRHTPPRSDPQKASPCKGKAARPTPLHPSLSHPRAPRGAAAPRPPLLPRPAPRPAPAEARLCSFNTSLCGGFEALRGQGYLWTNVTNTGGPQRAVDSVAELQLEGAAQPRLRLHQCSQHKCGRCVGWGAWRPLRRFQ